MNRLNCYVYVTGPDGGVHGFGPDSVLPDWAKEKITNPHVWESLQTETVVTVARGGEGGASDPGAGGAPTGETADGPPPQGGAGASRQRWVDYAAPRLNKLGIEIQADWKREDIIAACEKAGVPV